MTNRPTSGAAQSSEDVLWHLSSVLLGGPVVWGGIGYLLGRLTGWGWLFPVGIVLGFIGSFVIAYARYFSATAAGPPGRAWTQGEAARTVPRTSGTRDAGGADRHARRW